MIYILIAILALASVAVSQTNRRMEFQELGLSFEMPKGWSGQVSDDYFIMGHTTIPGLMILTKNTSKDVGEMKNLAMQGITDDGISLSPKGEFRTIGNKRVEGFYEGIFNGSSARVFAIGLINELGSGMNIFIVTEKDKFGETHVNEAKKLAATVRFFRQKETPNTKFWKQRIVGKQLKYMRTSSLSDTGMGYTGASTTEIVWLYANGTFSYYSSAETSGGNYEKGKDEGDGTYRIYSVQNKTYLQLSYNDEVVEYELSRSEENYTLLDGVRVAVLEMDR